MPRQPDHNPRQLQFGTSSENVPLTLPPQFRPEQHLSTARLLTAHSKLHVIDGFATLDELAKSDPTFLFWGLHVHPSDQAFKKTKNLSKLGVRLDQDNFRSWPHDYGLMLPPDEYRIVAHQPEGIAERVYAQTAAVVYEGEQPSDTDARANRSVGHTLDKYMKKQVAQGLVYKQEREGYGILVRDLTRKNGASVKAKNLEALRANADERIHQIVESVGQRYRQSDKEIASVHKAVRRRIYTGNFSSAERVYNFLNYVQTLGAYTVAKRARLVLAYSRMRDEQAKYQPFIDEEQARLQAESQAA